MTIQDAKKWIAVINDNVLENKAYLGELDSLMGDGWNGLFKSCPVYNGHLNRVSVYSGREGGGIINGIDRKKLLHVYQRLLQRRDGQRPL